MARRIGFVVCLGLDNFSDDTTLCRVVDEVAAEEVAGNTGCVSFEESGW
jgi:hypothetical protein